MNLGDKKVIWTGRIISGLMCLAFLMSSSMKLLGRPEVAEGMAHLGLPENLIFPLGVLELLCAVVYAIPLTGVLGAVLLTGYLGGAILTHLRVGEPVYTHIVLGVLIWAGIWLRDGRLRSILPLRR